MNDGLQVKEITQTGRRRSAVKQCDESILHCWLEMDAYEAARKTKLHVTKIVPNNMLNNLNYTSKLWGYSAE